MIILTIKISYFYVENLSLCRNPWFIHPHRPLFRQPSQNTTVHLQSYKSCHVPLFLKLLNALNVDLQFYIEIAKQVVLCKVIHRGSY